MRIISDRTAVTANDQEDQTYRSQWLHGREEERDESETRALRVQILGGGARKVQDCSVARLDQALFVDDDLIIVAV